MSDDIIVSIESQDDTINQFTVPSDELVINSEAEPEVVTINTEPEEISTLSTQDDIVNTIEISCVCCSQ